jgi:hypothetical protein
MGNLLVPYPTLSVTCAQVCCLRAPTLDAKAHFGVDASSRLETLTPIAYAQLLAPLKTLALQLLGALVPVLGSRVFVCRRDLAMCLLESLGFAWCVVPVLVRAVVSACRCLVSPLLASPPPPLHHIGAALVP